MRAEPGVGLVPDAERLAVSASTSAARRRAAHTHPPTTRKSAGKLKSWCPAIGTYTVADSLSLSRIGPSTSAEASAPMRIAICWNLGVAPTRKPVFRSCEVVPPFDAAMQTMAPTESAVT